MSIFQKMFSTLFEQVARTVTKCLVPWTNFRSGITIKNDKVEQRSKTEVGNAPLFQIAKPQLKSYNANWIIRKGYDLSDWLVKETLTRFCELRNLDLWQSPRHSSHRKFHRRKIPENALLLFILSFILITVGQCHPNSSHCFNCDDVNRLSTGRCPSTLNECGLCSPGYFDDSGNCVKIEVVVGPPEELEGAEGSDVEIACILNAKVSCDWTRNGEYVDIGASSFRYKYKSQDECTLVIEGLKPIDVGDWQCRPYGLKDLTITKVSLEKKQEVLVHPPESISALYGEPIVLTCLFNKPVVCSWSTAADETSPFNSVRIFGNYAYVDGTKGSKTDCSLIIKSLSREDEGEWKCSGQNETSRLTVETTSASITGCDLGKIPVNANHIYSNHTAVEGKQVDHRATEEEDVHFLSCAATKKVQRIRWKVNGNEIKTERNVQVLHLERHEIQISNFYESIWVQLECEISDGNDEETLYVSIPKQTKMDVIFEKNTIFRFTFEESFAVKTLIAICVLGVALYLIYKVLHLRLEMELDRQSDETENHKQQLLLP